MAHKTFTFDNVIIKELNMSNGVFNLIYSLPSVENKPYCLGLDVKEISLYEPPKYDPCRLFKKGDKVRVVDWNGRTLDRKGKIGEVTEDELGGRVTFSVGSHTFKTCYPVCFLELVTPVEELEPYSVEESGGGATLNCFIVKRGEKHVSYYLYKGGNANHYYTYEQAKARAEAERDRLNAEYRKEQE